MTEAPRRRWYVEDSVAEQRLHALDPDAEAIRLDRPRALDVRRSGGPLVGIVVGDAGRPLDLAAALADLATTDDVALLLPSEGLQDVGWLAGCAGWHLTTEPERVVGSIRVTIAPAGTGPPVGVLGALAHRRRRPASRRVAPWRVDLLDDVAVQWFGDLPSTSDHAALAVGATVPARDEDGPRRLLVVEDDTAADSHTADLAVTDDPTLAAEGVRLVARPVDTRRFSPAGSRPRAATGAPVLPVGAHARPDAVTEVRARATAAAEQLGTPAPLELALSGDGTPTGIDLELLRASIGLFDHPVVHDGPAAHARWLLACVAAGVPVVLLAPPPPVVAELLGDAVVDALQAATVDDLADPDRRDRASVLQRRQVLTRHTSTRRLQSLAGDLGLHPSRPRSVTAVLATNRREFLEFACGQIARQDWPRLEVVVVVHGDDPGGVSRRRLEELLGGRPTTLLHVDTRWSLGDALNLGIEHAAGDVVTKFDDDDWYSPSHVTDMLVALDHSGADLVGKGAEFVHLAASDTTLRRWGQGGESNSTTLAGGTLTMPRDVWRDVTGFPRVSVGEDRGLIDSVLGAGGTVYRTHPYGYLLHRHGDHAWSVPDQQFLDAAVATRPGRDHEWTLT